MLTDVVQVELVGKPWWEDLLPLAALALSIVSIVYTWWSRHTDRAKLEVKATSFVTNRGQREWNIGVRATNTGLTGSAVADGVHFKMARKRFAHMTESLESTAVLPATIAPDASTIFVVSSKGLAQELVAANRKPRHAIPVVTTGRKHYRGKFDKAGMDVLTAEYDAAKAAADKANPKTSWWARLGKR